MKKWRKKLHTHIDTHRQTHTHTVSWHTLPLPMANEVRWPITEFVYESPGKSNTTKMLKAAQKKERRSFCAIFPTASNGRRACLCALALSRALFRTLTHTHTRASALSLSLTLSLLLDADVDCAAWHIFFPSCCLTFPTVAHLRCVKRKRKAATCAARDDVGVSVQRESSYSSEECNNIGLWCALLAVARALRFRACIARCFVEFIAFGFVCRSLPALTCVRSRR